MKVMSWVEKVFDLGYCSFAFTQERDSMSNTKPQSVTKNQSMSSRKFLTIEIIVSAVINGGFGMLFGWLLGKNMQSIPFSGTGGIVPDVLVTAFLTGFLTTLIVTPILRGRIKKWDAVGGKPVVPRYSGTGYMKLLPQNLWVRALIIGLMCVAVLASIVLGVLYISDAAPLTPHNFIWVKALYGAFIGSLLTPFVFLPMLAGRVK